MLFEIAVDNEERRTVLPLEIDDGVLFRDGCIIHPETRATFPCPAQLNVSNTFVFDNAVPHVTMHVEKCGRRDMTIRWCLGRVCCFLELVPCEMDPTQLRSANGWMSTERPSF